MPQPFDLPDNLVERAEDLLKIVPTDLWDARALELLNNLPDGKSIGIACSGGADSTLCLLLIYTAFPEWRNRMIVTHLNHRLRGKSSHDDEAFVKQTSSLLGVRFVAERAKDHEVKANENSLRELRLKFWQKLGREKNLDFIVQGHQLDDVSEALLMRIPRGVSVDGLISPKPISKVGRSTFIRPFISLKKDFLKECLGNCGIPWREDESNQENLYLRNKMRNAVVPVWKESFDRDLLRGISVSRKLLELDSEALEFHASQSLEKCRFQEKLNLVNLGQLPVATRRRVLMKWIKERSESNRCISSLSLKSAQLDGLLTDVNFSTMQLSKNLFVRKINSFIELQENIVPTPIPLTSIPLGSSVFLPNQAVAKAHKIALTPEITELISQKKVDPGREAFLSNFDQESSFRIRSRKEGDAFQAIGSPGNKKLSDWMIDRKWKNAKKAQIPIFINSLNKIVWVPGLPPADFLRVSASDKWVIHLTYVLSRTSLGS